MSDDTHQQIPRLVPARMVNEYQYCKRLFYLEWVDGQFEHSADTVDGLFHHRAVDNIQSIPLPNGVTRDTSVSLSSERLGLIAVIDALEHQRDDSVIPIETKRGAPPNSPSRSWEPDRVQLCAQGLILRENGFRSDEGAVFYAETRERISIPFDSELITRTHRLLADLRVSALGGEIPPPLVDSPKCPRCSLASICLPDETNAILERSDIAPRRLLPRDPHNRPMYVTDQGATVGVRGDCLHVSGKRGRGALVKLIDVSQLCLYGSVQVSSQAVRRLFNHDVPTCWFSMSGWFQGIATGLPSKHIELRRRQFTTSPEASLRVARQMIVGKIHNSRTMLRRGVPRSDLAPLRQAEADAGNASSFATLLGIEGGAARTYFSLLGSLLRSDSLPGETFHFDGRNRRPPRDAVNCLLGYLYGLLTKELTVVAHGVGFDPYFGLYHRPRFGRPALALDLVEEFRPVIADASAIAMINNGEIRQRHFVERSGAVGLTDDGKKVVLGAYERKMDSEIKHPLFGYKARYRRILEVQCRLLAAHLLGETPGYTAFTTR